MLFVSCNSKMSSLSVQSVASKRTLSPPYKYDSVDDAHEVFDW
jgi:hypothetical protein